jgi:Fe2+ transport system protein FeoA
MGLVPGAELRVERVAPLGDPIEISVRGNHLSFRREEAEEIAVELVARGQRRRWRGSRR